MTHRRALACVHLVALLFGLVGVLGELIHASAVAITMGRAAFAAAVLALAARLRGKAVSGALTLPRAGALAFSGCLMAAHWVTFFVAVKVGGIAIATLGFASFPAFITLLESLLFRERVGAAEWLLLGLVTAGLVLVTPSLDLADSGTAGLAWGVASGLAFALLALANRRAAAGMDPLQVACGQNLVVALVTLPFAARELPALPAASWFWLAVLGVFCTGLAHSLFVTALAWLKARTVGMVVALEPVYAIAFAWACFGQQPGARTLLGAAVIVAAIVAAGLRAPAPARPRHAAAEGVSGHESGHSQ